jgi:hypothetical protein
VPALAFRSRRLSGYPVVFRAACLAALLIVALIGIWSVSGPASAAQEGAATPVAAQLEGEVHACAAALDGRLRHVDEPICAPDETLVTFNETDRVPEQLILCAATPQDPLRRVAEASACPADLVVLIVPDERVETRLCVEDATGAFRRQQDGACSAETERELVIPAGPSTTPTPVPPTATPVPATGTPLPAAPSATPTQAEDVPVPEASATTVFRPAGNQAPDPRDRRIFTLEDSASFLIRLVATDADGNTIRFQKVSAPTKGTLGSIFGTTCTGTIPKTCTASVRYNSDPNEYGYDSFTYRASDGTSSATATITIRIQGVNDAPSFTRGPNVTTPEDLPINRAWATNVKEGPLNEVKQSLNFVITFNSNPGLFATQPAVSPSGRLSFVPAVQATGSAIIKLRLHDSGGTANGGDDTSSLYSFTITIAPANDAPSFTPGPNVTVAEDSDAFSAAWASNMSPGPPDEAGQTTRFVASTEDLALFTIRPSIDPAGVLTFTPAPDADGVATIRVRIRDDGGTGPGDRYQSSPAHILTITITPINDEPGFTAGPNVTMGEDSGPYSAAWATNIDPGAPLESAQTLTFEITGNSNPGLFASGPTVAADGTLSFTPAANAGGSADIDIRLTDDGGTTNGGDDTCPVVSFTITVSPVNDAPINTVPGGQTVLEDTALVFSAGNGNLISVADVDAGGSGVQVTLTGENGTVSLSGTTGLAFITGDGTSDATITFTGTLTDIKTALNGLAFSPAIAFNDNVGAASLEITSNDQGSTGSGGAQTDSDTVAISVTPVNDEPSFALGGNQTVAQDAGAQTVAGFATSISAGAADESGQVLTFTVTNDNNSLFSAQPAIDAATGDLTYTPAAGQTGSALVTAVLSDNGGTANGGDDTSGAQTFTITVNPPNAIPVADSQSVSTDEDTPKAITLAGSDTEGAALTFAIVTGPTHGSLGAIGAPVCAGTPSACTAGVTYTPDADYAGPDSFTFRVNDGASDSAPATVSITVNPVNDAPVVNTSAGSASYTENDPAVAIDSALTVADVDNATLTGATVSISSGFTAGDELGFVNTPQITGSYNSGTGVLTLTGTATLAQYQTALRSISYRNTSDNPSTASRTVTYQVNDGTAMSNQGAKGVTVVAVNDAPVVANIEASTLAYTENDPATAISTTLTVADVDSANLVGATVAITSGFATGQDVLGFSNQNGITGSYNAATGVLTLTGASSVANYQTALRSITYANTSEIPSTVARTVSFQGDDGAALSNTATRDITVAAVNDAPILSGSKNYSANTNLQIAVPDGPSDLLAGWSDPESGSAVTIEAGSFSATTPAGGAVSEVDTATGAFKFDPPAGTTGNVTFTYRVCDDALPTPLCSANTTVTINVSGPVIWFVDDSAAAGGVGTLARPFQTLSAAGTAIGASTGQRIFLFDGTYANGRTLNANEWLIGQGVTGFASFDALFGLTPPSGTIDRPAIGSGTATVQNTVTLNTNAVVKALALATTTNTGLTDPAGTITGVTVDQVSVTTTTGTALLLSDQTTALVTLTSASVNGAATGISLTNIGAGSSVIVQGGHIQATTTTGVLVSGGSTTVTIDANLTTSTGRAIQVESRTGATVRFGGSFAITGGTGILLQNMTTGTPTVTFSGVGTTKSLSTGASDAFTLDNVDTATISIPSGTLAISTTSGTGLKAINGLGTLSIVSTTSTINASAGKAVDIDGGTVNATFATVSSAGSPSEGIRLNNLTGTLTINGGAITNASNADVAITGGTAAITYNGTITDDLGTLVSIANSTGGTKAFGGAITDGNDGDGSGIALTSNTGATITFTGGVVLSTGANPAFTATGGGTVTVTGTNTIATTTGTALNVANTTIGASGLTFRGISANGAANGIVLNNTGSSGGLAVTGTGSSGTGGTIQNTTSHGILLTTTRNASFNNMIVQNTAGSGVRGTTAVTNFAFTNSTINNSGTGGGNQDSSIAFNDPTGSATDAKVTGTVTITGNTLTNARWHGVSILQFAGTLDDVNISNNVITSGTTTGAGGSSLGSGIQLFAGGVAATVATVTRAELNNNTITNFPGGVLIAVQCGTSNGSGPIGSCGTPSSGTNDIEIQGNILNGGGTTPDGSGGVVKPNQIVLVTVNGLGQGNFNIQNNGTAADPLSGSAGNIIDISAGGNVTVKATVINNRIDAAGQTVGGTSGIAAGVGSFDVTGLGTLGASTLYATVQNNFVNNSAGSGIRLNVNNGTPTLNAIVTGNTVGAPISATYGIQVVEGPTGTKVTNLQISGNTAAGGSGGGNTFPGIGLRKQGTTTVEFKIVGLAPSPATNAQMESYVAGQNTSAAGTFGTNGVAAVNGASSNWTAIGSVPQP